MSTRPKRPWFWEKNSSLNSVQENNVRTISQAENGSGAISNGGRNPGWAGSPTAFCICLCLGHKQTIKKQELRPRNHCCHLDREGGGCSWTWLLLGNTRSVVPSLQTWFALGMFCKAVTLRACSSILPLGPFEFLYRKTFF